MIIYCNNTCLFVVFTEHTSANLFKKQQLESELHVTEIMKFKTKIKTSVNTVDGWLRDKQGFL